MQKWMLVALLVLPGCLLGPCPFREIEDAQVEVQVEADGGVAFVDAQSFVDAGSPVLNEDADFGTGTADAGCGPMFEVREIQPGAWWQRDACGWWLCREGRDCVTRPGWGPDLGETQMELELLR